MLTWFWLTIFCFKIFQKMFSYKKYQQHSESSYFSDIGFNQSFLGAHVRGELKIYLLDLTFIMVRCRFQLVIYANVTRFKWSFMHVGQVSYGHLCKWLKLTQWTPVFTIYMQTFYAHRCILRAKTFMRFFLNVIINTSCLSVITLIFYSYYVMVYYNLVFM